MCPTTSSGLRRVRRQHGRDALLRRQHDGQLVRPVVVEEEAVEILLACPARRRRGLSSGRTRAVPVLSGVDGPGQPLDDFLHDGAAGDRVRAVDIGAQLGGGLAHDGLGDEDLPEPGHAVVLARPSGRPCRTCRCAWRPWAPRTSLRSSSRARRPPARRCFSGRRRGWRRAPSRLISSHVVGSSLRYTLEIGLKTVRTPGMCSANHACICLRKMSESSKRQSTR